MTTAHTFNFRVIVAAALAAVLALSILAGSALANNGKGNSARSHAEPAVITEVAAETSNPEASNFEEEFTYYVIRFEEIEYDTWTYRAPAERGGNNDFVSDEGGTADAFWFGVSAPDPETGIQSEIVHKGQVSMYYESDNGDVVSIIAQFNGKGELLHVNGVEPAE